MVTTCWSEMIIISSKENNHFVKETLNISDLLGKLGAIQFNLRSVAENIFV